MKHSTWIRRSAVGVTLAVAAAGLAACGTPSDGGGESKLIIAITGFDCGLNGFTETLCTGFEDAKADLPEGYTLEVKNGTDFNDSQALTNLIETSIGLDPAGLIVFSAGPAAQVPVLTRACEQGITVFILDNDMPTLDCRTSLVQTDNEQAGREAGEWLVAQDPVSTDIGIVNWAPGQYVSNDLRESGFREVVEAAGFTIAATVVADSDIEKTRTQVENMLEANPNLGAIFSPTDFFGDGTSQALLATGRDEVLHVSIDGNLSSVARIPDEALDADVAQNPYSMAKTAVSELVRSLSGEEVERDILIPVLVVTADNAAEYIANNGKF